eukprot:Gb_04574 [translate_table: standard]
MAQAVSRDEIESFRNELAEVGKNMKVLANSRASLGSRRTNLGIFSGPSSRFGDDVVDDEEALHWAAIERLPTYNRIRASILKDYDDTGKVVERHVVDVGHLKPLERHVLIDKLIKDTEEDNEKFLRKLRNRIDKVGIELPTVEVRYENLRVEAECRIGSRALPTLWNVTRNIFEGLLNLLHLSPSKKTNLTILKDVSGIIKPSR